MDNDDGPREAAARAAAQAELDEYLHSRHYSIRHIRTAGSPPTAAGLRAVLASIKAVDDDGLPSEDQ